MDILSAGRLTSLRHLNNKGLHVLNAIIQTIKNHYGSKYGLKNQCIYSMMIRFGDFKQYKDIDFKQVKRLVFICSGNICRSPLAEAVAIKAGIESISYGLNCRGGDKADPRAIAFASKNDFNLENHITKNINLYVPHPGDLLVGMEPNHAKALEELLGPTVGPSIKITVIGLWLPVCKAYIHDPFNANEIFFSRCETEVVAATNALIAKLRH